MKSKELIEERANSYKVHIPYTDNLGNRKFYSKSFLFKKYGTKQRALEYAKNHRDEMKVKFANGMIINKKHYTLDEIYEESMKVYNATLGTKKKVNCTYKNYIQKFIGGNRDFASIKYNDIQKNLNELQSIAKDDTIARTTAIWRRIYRYAVAMDIVVKDETYNITTPKSDIITIKKPMSVSYEDFIDTIQKINNFVRDERENKLIQGALWIMYYTGMRPSEVLALESHNIDFEYRDIFVCESVGTTSIKKNTIRKTKNESSIRHIPIFSDELASILKELIALSPNGYIFTRKNGELMNGTYLSNICYYVSKGQFRPYMLRHQFSTDLLMKGTDLRTIQELMGHKESSMTLGYARSNDELKLIALRDRKKLLN